MLSLRDCANVSKDLAVSASIGSEEALKLTRNFPYLDRGSVLDSTVIMHREVQS